MKAWSVSCLVWPCLIAIAGCTREAPETAGLFFEAGAVALREGRNLEAISKFRRAVEINPSHAEAHYGLGLAYKNVGAFDKAIVEMEKSLQVGTHFERAHFAPRAHYQLGTLYVLKGTDDKAIQHWKEAVRLRPRLFGARNNLAITFHRLGRYEEEIEEWRALLRTPGYTTPQVARSNLSAAYRANGKVEEALTQAKIAVEVAKQLEVEYAGAYKNLGQAYAEKGQYEQAIEAYQEVLMVEAGDSETYYLTGVAYEALGNKPEALKAYRIYRDSAATSERDEEVNEAIQRLIREP